MILHSLTSLRYTTLLTAAGQNLVIGCRSFADGKSTLMFGTDWLHTCIHIVYIYLPNVSSYYSTRLSNGKNLLFLWIFTF